MTGAVRSWGWLVILLCFSATVVHGRQAALSQPLSLWRDRPVKEAIVRFVRKVTDPADPAFVPPADRIVTIDMDGTLLCERPLPFGMLLAENLLRELAGAPQLEGREPFDAARNGGLKGLRKEHFELFFGMSGAGLTEDAVQSKVRALARDGHHPRFERPYRELFYRPMLQLIAYLVQNDFIVYVLSGSDQTVVRTICAERTELASLPPSRFIGTLVALDVDYRSEGPVYYRLARELEPVNLRKGKAMNIQYRIGQNPVLAIGNSSGDCGMLAATRGAGYPATLRLLLRHDDPAREYDYARSAEDLCREQAGADILSISMKDDFERVFEFDTVDSRK